MLGCSSGRGWSRYTGGTVQERLSADHHNQKSLSTVNQHTLILIFVFFCINYSLNFSRHAVNHTVYALPSQFIPLFFCNLYYFPSTVGAPLSGPLFVRFNIVPTLRIEFKSGERVGQSIIRCCGKLTSRTRFFDCGAGVGK